MCVVRVIFFFSCNTRDDDVSAAVLSDTSNKSCRDTSRKEKPKRKEEKTIRDVPEYACVHIRVYMRYGTRCPGDKY